MSTVAIRPRFRRDLPWPQEEVLTRLEEALQNREGEIVGFRVDHHFTLRMPPEERHFWSPQLQLEVEEQEEGSLLRGLFGPSPSVWLLFVFFYGALGFAGTVILVIGLSQWSLDLPAGILLLLPVIGFFIAMVYLTARTGQKLGKDEMVRLQDFLDEALEEAQYRTRE